MPASDPLEVIRRVPGWAGKARVVGELAGGITNRNVVVEVDGERFVVRIPGADTRLLGIDRTVEREASARAAGLGIAPDVVAFVEPEGALVTRFVAGSPIPPDSMTDPAVTTRIAAMLRSFHESGPVSGSFDAFAVPARQIAAANARGVAIPDDYAMVEERVREIARAFAAAPDPPCPGHNDLLAANFLRDGEQLWLLDWEYAGMNDRAFDLGNLAVNNAFSPDAEVALVEAYFGRVCERDLARVRLMTVVSDARESTWGLVQQAISTIEFDYAGYAQEHLDRLQRTVGGPSYRGLLDAAAVPDPAPR